MVISSNFPFEQSKIPVIYGNLNELVELIKKYPDFYFCPYIADKNEAAWNISTSRVYMNKILPNFIYQPFNISPYNIQTLSNFFMYAQKEPKIIAVNITQPHKSNPMVKACFPKTQFPKNTDCFVRKTKNSHLIPLDLNGPSFVGWFEEEIKPLINSDILLVGVGGVGETIARSLATCRPNSLTLIDPVDKYYLVTELSPIVKTQYYPSLIETNSTKINSDNFVVINASGKEGNNLEGLNQVLNDYQKQNFIFVDMRPQLDIPTVNSAKELGWQAYTGFGMNARNDYSLLSEITHALEISTPTFTEFKNLVAQAS